MLAEAPATSAFRHKVKGSGIIRSWQQQAQLNGRSTLGIPFLGAQRYLPELTQV
ncbi:MAG: hypothetical protein H6Q76_499 [Firmicutes bacterium]|nr:hypothetical protein [Bacillota bacterium]